MAAKKNLLEELLENKPFMYIVGGLLAYKFVINPLLITVGLKKSDEEIYNDAAGVTAAPWDVNYWQQSTDEIFTGQGPDIDTMLDDLAHSFHLFYDDFEKILSVFKQLKTQRQVSFLCYRFQLAYKKDLYTYLVYGGGSGVPPFTIWDGLSQDNLTILNTYVNSLPAA